ncbi:hypothetical protein MBLNU457_6500t2 [Dothideomycetes sp. NU457]
MALATPPHSDRKRVKVYELRNNDWYDRGTGFCAGHVVSQEESHIIVQSEDDPQRALLETRISKDDGYQKQQDTLIVWTEPNGVDMALSFQEADGCASIWEFVSEVQQRLIAMAPEDAMEDDTMDGSHAIMLPNPELGNLHEVENIMRSASATHPGREALVKFIMSPESLYIPKLIPLVEMAEDLEDLTDLHRLCNIMKTLILLNDTAIIELVVRDEVILGVVGALEYDPDFPSHKANHRQYLSDESKFKEVVKIENPETRRKIHYTYRLQYLKDVVLARILDDPTFSVLNSLIFFHQVDIVNHICGNGPFLTELFGVFGPHEQDKQRRKDAVLFIQTCCAVAKNIQAVTRAQLFQNFINGGLLSVISFALRHPEAAVRVAGTDILVALIDHDPAMIRTYIFKAINEKSKPLTDTLIELLLIEVDLGVKAQMADAIKILLDPQANAQSMDMLGRTNGDFLAKMRTNAATAPQTDSFIENFYNDSAKKLFQPLKDLEFRKNRKSFPLSLDLLDANRLAIVDDLTVQEASLYEHLVSVLSFFIRSHSYRSKFFTLSEGLHARVAQLMSSPQKHLKLCALKWFRTCLSLGDEFHNRQIIQFCLLEPVLAIVEQTLPKDNLLNSVCLEMFEFLGRDAPKPLLVHLVETYRDRLAAITYVETFPRILWKYEQLQAQEDTSFSTQGADTPNKVIANGGPRWQGLREADPEEDAYFNTSDGEEEDAGLPQAAVVKSLTNGDGPAKPLVAYPDDEEEDAIDALGASPSMHTNQENHAPDHAENESPSARLRTSKSKSPGARSPPERPSEKRRREEDEEDDLVKIAAGSTPAKRRNSVGPNQNKPSESPDAANKSGPSLRRKGSLRSKDSVGPSKVTGLGSISISLKSNSTGKEGGNDE